MRKKGFLWIVMGVALLGFFCVGMATVNASNKKGTACSQGLSSAEAASVLGVKANDLNVRSFPQMVSPDDTKNKTYKVPPCSYSYRSKTNFRKGISYVVYIYNDPKRARRDYETMKGNFATSAKVEKVPGLGDEAFWVNDKRFHRLVAIKGNRMVDILNPTDVKLQKRVMVLVLKK